MKKLFILFLALILVLSTALLIGCANEDPNRRANEARDIFHSAYADDTRINGAPYTFPNGFYGCKVSDGRLTIYVTVAAGSLKKEISEARSEIEALLSDYVDILDFDYIGPGKMGDFNDQFNALLDERGYEGYARNSAIGIVQFEDPTVTLEELQPIFIEFYEMTGIQYVKGKFAEFIPE